MTGINVDQSMQENEAGLKKLAWALEASQGKFKLLIARCNYGWWRSHLIKYLQAILETKNIHLDVLELQVEDRNLLHRIEQDFGENQPVALTVVGLENLENLELFLVALNQLRDNFHLKCPFPLLIWLNDDIYQQLVKIAPDFESWSTTRQFLLHQADLLNFLEYAVAEFFQKTFALEASGFYRQLQNTAVGYLQRQELNFAIASLEKKGQVFSASLQTDLQLIQAMEKHGTTEGFQHLENCQQFWQGETAQGNCLGDCRLKLGLVKFYLGAYYLYKDFNAIYENYQKEHPTSDLEQLEYWKKARSLYEESISLFQAENRRDLVGKVIIELERALQRLKLWDELEIVATEALILHEDYHRQHKLAQDYIFLAEVALAKESYEVSKQLAQKGLEILLVEVPVDERWDAGLYYLFLAQAEKHLGNLETSLQYLLTAKDLGDLGHPRIYLRILKELREIYLSEKDYLAAFEIKQLQLEVEHQYGLRSFIGAGYLRSRKQEDNPLNTDKSENIAVEIVNSGRSLDVSRLLGRLAGNDSKLIVIHGFSEVGKSSLIKGGLMPALTKEMIGYHKNFPVYVRDYQNWVLELGRSLQNVLIESHLFDGNLASLPDILGQLELSESRFLRTILIFDQFEEFFFSNPEPAQRQEFFGFLGDCLRFPDVRVVLSLREDYLHYLLECDRIENMQIFNGDILGKNIRYRLGNFSLVDARIVVENLTRGSRASFPADLIEALVADLGKKLGEVRPIELQIVGAQMQTENIKTLATYQEQGPLNKLVDRYLEVVIKDCGPDNEKVAETLLYFLTDDRGTRPRRTREELEKDLKDIVQIQVSKEQLDLILTVFVGCGLVMLLPDAPADRYQLVHDYLAELIRKDQEPRLKTLMAELEEEKKKRGKETKQKEKYLRFSQLLTGLSLVIAILAGFSAWNANINKKQAVIASIEAMKNNADFLLESGKHFEAWIQALKVNSKLKENNLLDNSDLFLKKVDIELAKLMQNAIDNAIYFENKTLPGHDGGVYSVSFSPDGETIASASTDKKVKLWNRQGKFLYTLTGHSEEVNSVSFSPDGKTIASASSDKTVKLWNRQGKLLSTLTGHSEAVNSVSFSPDGETIASASGDFSFSHNAEVKLWNRQGKLLSTLTGHSDAVNSVSFSPDGETIASASSDKTVKLWNRQGKLLNTLTGHDSSVNSVSFSPDGETIASASDDDTVKLWNRQGKLLNTLTGHDRDVRSVSFSPNGETIASVSDDKTVKLWNRQGKFLSTLTGHDSSVNSVSFSPDGETIAVAGGLTVKLWNRNRHSKLLYTLTSHSGFVQSVSFSPDGETIASASDDETVKLWNRQGKLLNTLTGHDGDVYSVSFSPNGETIVSAGGTMVKWWSRQGKLLNTLTLTDGSDFVRSVSFSPDGEIIASTNLVFSSSDSLQAKLWNRQGILFTLTGHSDAVWDVSFSPDGETIASASRDKTVKLWNRQGKLLNTLTGHSDAVWDVSFSPDGETIASASEDKTVKLWNRQGKLLNTLTGHSYAVWDVSFSPDGETIASASWDSSMLSDNAEVKLWNRQGKLLNTLTGHDSRVLSVSFSPDGETIASASLDNTVKLWNRQGKLLSTLTGHDYPVNSVSFSPDGETIASASNDKTVKLWNTDLINIQNKSCEYLHDYLVNNPKVLAELTVCQKPIIKKEAFRVFNYYRKKFN
jgi:WD40 repeat protein